MWIVVPRGALVNLLCHMASMARGALDTSESARNSGTEFVELINFTCRERARIDTYIVYKTRKLP